MKKTLILLLLLHTANANAIAWVPVAIAAATYLLQSNTPKGDGGISILIAMSNNITEINKGIQAINSHIGEINEKLESIPKSTFELIEKQEVLVVVDSLAKLQKSKKNHDPLFNKRAYYRDVYEIYNNGEKVQSKILNDEFKYAFVFYVPMLFIIQSSAYSMHTEMLTGLPEDEISEYRINRGMWIESIKRYLNYYNQQNNPTTQGGFAWALKKMEDTNNFAPKDSSDFNNLRELIRNNIKKREFDAISGNMCYPVDVKKMTYFTDCHTHDYDESGRGGLDCQGSEDYFKYNIAEVDFRALVIDGKTPEFDNPIIIYSGEERDEEYKSIITNYMESMCTEFAVSNQDGMREKLSLLLNQYINHSLRYMLLLKIDELNKSVSRTIYTEAKIFIPDDELKQYPYVKQISEVSK